MKIAIIGFGIEGHAALQYWQPNNEITICDQNSELTVPEGVASQLGSDYLQELERFDMIVRSPFVHPTQLIDANTPDILQKVTSNTNEFLEVCPTPNIIGVTGTKGKGTTSTLIAKMLVAAGKTVHLGGNIGVAPLELLRNDIQPSDWVVLELSNFQLIDLKRSPHLAVCLMVAPEHLDWHPDVAEYYQAKSQLFAHQTINDIAVYYAANQDSKHIADAGAGQQIPYFAPPGAVVDNGEIKIDDQLLCRTDELKLLGAHNWQNVCAALTVGWQISQDVAAFRAVLTSFSGLPFRIEPRGEKHGIRYYNDSFASQPSATVAALHSIPGSKVIIVGGFERGLDLTELANALQQSADEIRKVVVIGASGSRVAEQLQAIGFDNFVLSGATTMPEVVSAATSCAEVGDAVVLSPGFASYDMFQNFEDRGRQFNAAVEVL